MARSDQTVQARYFDLNIIDILEAWSPCHAIRELIANAFDEQVLTKTGDPTVEKVGASWIIKDCGRGIRYEHLTQNESAEKLANPSRAIGKFGVGLKDAIAVLRRHDISLKIRSAHAEITFTERPKHGFEEVPTLHAEIRQSRNAVMVGTEVVVTGCPDSEVNAAKNLFLRFSGEQIIGETAYGQIVRRGDRSKARVYVNGVVVAEDDQFVFSYNITSLNAAMRKALNRERTNVGRTAFADRIQAILLACTSPVVAEILAREIALLDVGTAHDEVKWSAVALHACKILNAAKKVVFVSSADLRNSVDAVDHARDDGYDLVTLPQKLRERLSDEHDLTGAPVRALDVFVREWAEGFKFDFVDESRLNRHERAIFDLRGSLAQLVGGWPKTIKQLLVSATMRPDVTGRGDALGLCDEANERIIIRRDQLRSVESFAGTLIHEIVHARSGHDDVTRDFEDALTDEIGVLAAKALSRGPAGSRKPVYRGAQRSKKVAPDNRRALKRRSSR